jgi:hypothetical protein
VYDTWSEEDVQDQILKQCSLLIPLFVGRGKDIRKRLETRLQLALPCMLSAIKPREQCVWTAMGDDSAACESSVGR